LVQSANRPLQMTGTAGRDLYLNVTGRLREDVPTFTIGIDSLSAGRDVDVLMQTSVKETSTPANSGGGLRTVPSQAYARTHRSHSRPDSNSATPALDPGLFADPATAIPIDSAYRFGLVRAGHANAITAADPSPAAKRIDVTATSNIVPDTETAQGEKIDV